MAQGTVTYRLVFLFAILAAALVGGSSGVWLVDRDLPVVINSAETATPIVKPGGELRIEYTLLRKRSCEVTSDRFIIDAHKVRFELPDLNIKSGLQTGPDHYIVPVEVKPEAALGPATYRTITSYVCNPIQRLFPIEAGQRDINFVIRE